MIKQKGKIVYLFQDGLFWFRIFGYGLHIKDTTRHPLLFFERNGYKKKLLIGKWCIKGLKRD